MRAATVVPAALGPLLLCVALLAGATRGTDARRGRCRAWLRDSAMVLVVTTALAAHWMVRHPRSVPAAGTILALLVLTIGAVVEEVVYRGWLLERIAAATPARLIPALLSTLAFAAAHPITAEGSDPTARFLSHAVAGALFCALRGRDGTLVAPMLAHTTYNAAVHLATD
jgi:membrane protease YdiL (CAAX protease family)